MRKNLDITQHAEDEFYDITELDAFRDEDADVIYEHLTSKMKLVPFGDYLKRYIYLKAGFEESFEEIDDIEYRSIICSCFRENNTPPSFTGSSVKLSVLAKNWLNQSSVNRKVVFLLGFGLKMSENDVSDFLMKALKERDFDFKDPFELICRYCYRNGLKYSDFLDIYEEYNALPDAENSKFMLDETTVLRRQPIDFDTREGLIKQLAEMKIGGTSKRISVTARKWFNRFYGEVQKIVADNMNADEEESTGSKVRDYIEKAEHSDKLSPEDISKGIQRIRSEKRTISSDDITEGDVEKFIYSGVPVDSKGNLMKYSKSSLAASFDNKRLNRQHLHDINCDKSDIDRFDLITLSFVIVSQDATLTNNQRRFYEFVERTNLALEDCSMGKLYIANPYECFLLLCLLSDCPLATFTEVFEKSYKDKSE